MQCETCYSASCLTYPSKSNQIRTENDKGQPGKQAKTATSKIMVAGALCPSLSVSGNCSQTEKFELQLRNVEQDFGLWCSVAGKH